MSNLFTKILLFIAILFFSADGVSAQIIGDIDTTFNPSDIGYGEYVGANGRVYSVLKQPDGKLLIGGDFSSYNNVSRNRIARLNADGSLDMTFNPGAGFAGTTPPSVRALKLQPDGKIIVAGKFLTFDGVSRNRIARLNADGSLDASFNPGTGTSTTASHYIQSMVLQADGKIIIAGLFTSFNGTSKNCIARLNTDGSLDATFNGTGTSTTSTHYIYTMAQQADGKILVGGNFTSLNGTSANRIMRINADGTIDNTFSIGTGATASVRNIAVQADGKIIVAGEFTSFNATTAGRIVRLNANGSIDAGFNGAGSGANTGAIFALKLQADQKILIGGSFIQFNGTSRNKIARLNDDGSLDTSFIVGNGITTELNDFEIDTPSQKILIAGSFESYNAIARKNITRLASNGAIDYTFNPETGINGSVYSTAIQADQKIIVGGYFTHVNGSGIRNLARLHPDGSLDTTFNTGSGTQGSGIVEVVKLQADGKILAGGYFTAYDGVSRNGIARINTDGSLDTTFNPGTGVSGSSARISTIAIQDDGKIVIAGLFDSFNGITTKGIIRLNQDGSVDATFNPGGSGINGDYIYSLALQSDGKILIVGGFTQFNGINAGGIARLNTDGTLDLAFNTNTGTGATIFGNLTQLYSVYVRADGKILIAGLFDKFNNITSRSIALLNSDGTLDATSFSSGTGTSWNEIHAMTVQPDGKILLGGNFNIYNGNSVNRICRINADGSFDNTFDPGIGAAAKVYSISLQYEKKIIIAGDFTAYNGIGRNRIARLYGDHCLPLHETEEHTICAGTSLVWIDGNTYTSNNDTATFLVAGASPAGCDIIKQLNLTVLDSFNTDVTTNGTTLTAALPGAVYQWLDCDNGNAPVAGATAQSFTPQHAGTYAVRITVDSCSLTSACHTVDGVSIRNDKEAPLLQLYPNPVADLLHLSFEANAVITLTDVIGKTVGSGTLTAGTATKLDLSQLPKGIYLLKITYGNTKSILRKIIKL